MSRGTVTGIGEPQPVGKKALFQPEVENNGQSKLTCTTLISATTEMNQIPNRVRTTLELTNHAMSIIQEIQCSHRLLTGKVLPLWKLVSRAIESYGKETGHPPISHPEPALHEPDGKRKV
jgi:hypothetical protein